jgi:hypothetical protein
MAIPAGEDYDGLPLTTIMAIDTAALAPFTLIGIAWRKLRLPPGRRLH